MESRRLCESCKHFEKLQGSQMCFSCKFKGPPVPCSHAPIANQLSTIVRGQPVKCSDCSKGMILIDCPYQNCNYIFYRDSGYWMGKQVECLQCKGSFKQLVCNCGNSVHLQDGKFFPGFSLFECTVCKADKTFTICPYCTSASHYDNKRTMGETILCKSCHQTYILLLCPECTQPQNPQEFYQGMVHTCVTCKAQFDYTFCPKCEHQAFTIGENTKKHTKTCNLLCGAEFVHFGCMNCHEPNYIQKIQEGGWGVTFTKICIACSAEIKYTTCQKCKDIHVGNEKCSVKNQPVEDKPDLTCKVCLDKPSTQINVSCGHLALCEQCLANLSKGPKKNQCVICRKIGTYIKVHIA